MSPEEQVDVTTITPIDHAEAMRLQEVELGRVLELARELTPSEWTAPTDCPEWDVRRMVLHLLGACEAAASMRENLHQMRAGRRYQKAGRGPLESGISDCQVRDREPLTPAELVERLDAVLPRAIRKRTSLPALVRKQLRMKIDAPVVETWRLGYLIDVIYLRDAWMHRIDICRATGRDLVLTAEHDGRVIADVVAELARRSAEPFALELTGAAGGSFRAGAGGEPQRLDAIALCRILAGRDQGTGVLATVVPF